MAQQDAEANEIGDELSDDDYMTTYGTLETLRDDERLTADQRSVLHEAHAIVQEAQRERSDRDDQPDEDEPLRAEGLTDEGSEFRA